MSENIENKNSKTYKDFEIGENVVLCGCGEPNEEEELYNIYLTLGNSYVITDLDFHFHDKICITRDNGHGMFVPIKYFNNTQKQREVTINKLLK